MQGFSLGAEDSQKNGATAKKSGKGGFQGMGLSYPVYSGIMKRGYKVPTPIQRKTIPIILEGRDVVAMAKTGSGKTACFLIPLFEKLKIHRPDTGPRAIILSPTRELAIQTFKFIKDLGKFMDLKTVLVLGGDSMDYQFGALHSHPDIIVATPGRFLHVCVEMDMKLKSIEYVVFDEADRLFEMGFGEQLNEILRRLPSSRQMLLFSATLPKLLVEFAKADLNDPVLIRLDVESKLPDALCLKYVFCRPDERLATLVVMIKTLIPDPKQVVVFAATQHHVEFLSRILAQCGITNTYIFSNLDPSARKINTAKFQQRQVKALIVTDVAARGIDIPHLDFVINFHFPGKPKLFIHRVGRCARAGRSGTAYSIFSTEDQAHMMDLHLFLNRPVDLNDTASVGRVPTEDLEMEHHSLLEMLRNQELEAMNRKGNNGYKQYLRTRPAASASSNKLVKEWPVSTLKVLNEFPDDDAVSDKKQAAKNPDNEWNKDNLLANIKKYRPQSTIFELNAQQQSHQRDVMVEKRKVHGGKIELRKKRKLEEPLELERQEKVRARNLPTFQKQDEFYINYKAKDQHTEDGLAINPFQRELQDAELSLGPDNEKGAIIHRKTQRWDRLRKKMVAVRDPREGKIQTEAGVWIPATYKAGKYDEWRERTKVDEMARKEADDADADDAKGGAAAASASNPNYYPKRQIDRHNLNMKRKAHNARDKELKTPDQLVKNRIRLENLQHKQQDNRKKNLQKRKNGQKKRNDRMNRKHGATFKKKK